MKHNKKSIWISIAALVLSICILTGGFLWYASVNGAIRLSPQE